MDPPYFYPSNVFYFSTHVTSCKIKLRQPGRLLLEFSRKCPVDCQISETSQREGRIDYFILQSGGRDGYKVTVFLLCIYMKYWPEIEPTGCTILKDLSKSESL